MSKAPAPGRDLVRRIRIGFITQDKTFTGWCRENDIHITGARQALIGTWDGPKGRALRARIAKAAGITADAS